MEFIHVHSGRPLAWLAPMLAVLVVLAALACQSDTPTQPATQDTGGASNTPTAGSENAEHNTAAIDLPIVERGTTTTRDDLQVTQGDTVRLTFTSDEPGEIHLHGYDLTAGVSPGHPGELVFEAENAGAFGINFHVFASETMDDAKNVDSHSHGEAVAETVESDVPVSVSITADVDAEGGVNVAIAADGLRFAPELADQAHTPGTGHGHIYVDGHKLGRVFGPTYRIDDLSPGDHEIRVSLNTNDHRELVYNGRKAEDTVTVTVPDVGQGSSSHDHSHDHGSEQEIIAEVHLGNLEVYPK